MRDARRGRRPGSFEVAWRSTASVEVLGRHAGAVVDDADEPPPAGLDRDLDRARAGVDRVLDQLLHGGGRPLDHLARGDAVDEDGIEAADGMACMCRLAEFRCVWSEGRRVTARAATAR